MDQFLIFIIRHDRLNEGISALWRANSEWKRWDWLQAGRLLGECQIPQDMRRRGWGEEELESRAKADPAKLMVAERLRAETTVTTRWIAGRLQMGSPG